jgi:hypothetical protein
VCSPLLDQLLFDLATDCVVVVLQSAHAHSLFDCDAPVASCARRLHKYTIHTGVYTTFNSRLLATTSAVFLFADRARQCEYFALLLGSLKRQLLL